MPGSEMGIFGGGRASVPGTDILADVTAEDVPSQPGPAIGWDFPAQLDRQIRDAEPRVDGVSAGSRNDGVRRARFDAARASPAAIGRGSVRLQLERGENFSQEDPRPQLLIDNTGIPSDPAESRQPGVAALQKWCCIDADLPLELHLPAQFFDQLRHPRPHDVVVVVAPGIAGDPGSRGLAIVGMFGRVGCGPVVNLTQTDDRPGRGQQSSRILPDICPIVGEVAHSTRKTSGRPFSIASDVSRGIRRGEAAQLEAATGSRLPNLFLVVHFLLVQSVSGNLQDQCQTPV